MLPLSGVALHYRIDGKHKCLTAQKANNMERVLKRNKNKHLPIYPFLFVAPLLHRMQRNGGDEGSGGRRRTKEDQETGKPSPSLLRLSKADLSSYIN